jgi:hypothetical protein
VSTTLSVESPNNANNLVSKTGIFLPRKWPEYTAAYYQQNVDEEEARTKAMKRWEEKEEKLQKESIQAQTQWIVNVHARVGDKPKVHGRRKWTNVQDRELLKGHRISIGQPSACDLLPYFNKFVRTPFDLMHNMLLGLMKTFCKEVAQNGTYGNDKEDGSTGESSSTSNRLAYALFTPTEERQLATLIKEVSTLGRTCLNAACKIAHPVPLCHVKQTILPSHVSSITDEFFEKSSGSATAAEWRSFAINIAPMVFVELWVRTVCRQTTRQQTHGVRTSPDELRVFMDLFQAIQLLLRPTISETQIREGENHLLSLIPRALQLHKGLARSKNLHQVLHIPGNIRDHGPVYCWWLFASERMNKTLKNMNSNGHTRKTAMIAFNAYQRYARSNHLMRSNLLQTDPNADDLMARNVAELLSRLFQNVTNQHYSTDEQDTARAWEQSESELRDGMMTSNSPVLKIRLTKGQLVVLSVMTQAMIQQKLRSIGIIARREHQGSDGLSDNCLTLARDAESFSLLQVGRTTFRPFSCSKKNELSEKELYQTKDAFVELRTQKEIYQCTNGRAQVSVIHRIIRHNVKDHRGSIKQSRLYLEVGNLQPYEGTDHYGFRNL